jgi:hypothetical protein
MAGTDLAQQLEELFREAGAAHHQAYIETDGADPEWPLWYADYLRERPGALLDVSFTREPAGIPLDPGRKRATAQRSGCQLGQILCQVLYHRIHINLRAAWWSLGVVSARCW